MKELIEKLDCVRFQPYDGVVVYRDEAGKEETLWGVITETIDTIERLQAELEQTKRERNAAVADINCGCICVVCKNEKYCKMAQNPLCDEEEPCHFEWRGVQEESE